MIRMIFAAAITASAFSSMALAQNASEQGTPEQRAACGPSVRKYCYMLKPTDSVFEYQRCLEANRPKIGPKCQMVLDGRL
jgi:hypothetical protein